MSKIEDGGPAFPMLPPDTHNYREWPASVGMSLRDYFAAAAITGLCAAAKPVIVNGKEVGHDVAAYLLADGMLAERTKVQP